MKWLTVVGIGEDGVDAMSPRARKIIAGATLVVGGARHLALADALIAGERLAWPSPIAGAFDIISAHRGEQVVVLASGDPSHFGIATTVAGHFACEEMDVIPAVSSMSLACARLGWAVQDVTVVSACGRPLAAVRPYLASGARLIVLSAGASTPHALADMLTARGFGASTLTVMEALGGPRERVRIVSAAAMPDDIGPLNLVAIDCTGGPALSRVAGRDDELFENDGQITKSEVRAMTLAALSPYAGALLWDIGCGSGAIGIEWALSHPDCRAIGIEADPVRAERAARNAERLGAVSASIVHGMAPAALQDLPVPDAMFIGGGADDGAIDAGWAALRPGGKMVANAVTIETELKLFAAFRAHGGTMTRLSVERLDTLGPQHGFKPARAITQWAATK